MGFLSKVRKRIKKQIRPNNMMIGNMRNMPRRPNILGRGSLGILFYLAEDLEAIWVLILECPK